MGLLSSLRTRLGFGSARPVSSSGWYPLTIREPFIGAWQLNQDIAADSALRSPTIWACHMRITQDIKKIAPPRLLEDDGNDIWTKTSNPAYSPFLRKPNDYQLGDQFIESWVSSKLLTGNTIALKGRDARGVVAAAHVLDATRTRPLVAPDGSVYYELAASDLASIAEETVVPAREVIHDRWNCAFHPLQGLPPLYAAGITGALGTTMQQMMLDRFSKGGRPSGLLIAPTDIDQDTADRIKEKWRTTPPGEILVGKFGMQWHEISANAADMQLAELFGIAEETIASCFGMHISIVNSAKQPPYANAEASQLQYKSLALQPHFASIAASLTAGLDLPSYLKIGWDYEDLIVVDTVSKTQSVRSLIDAGVLAPNEGRRIFNLPPVKGGEKPLRQQQYFPLDERPRPVTTPTPQVEEVEPVDAA